MSSNDKTYCTITHSSMTKSNLQEIVVDEAHPEINQAGGIEPEAEGTEKNKPEDKQVTSLQQEVGISLDDIEISSNLALKTAKEVLPENIKFQKDSKLALGKAATVFISYLGSTAQDVCSKSKRKQITPADVYAALEAIDFPELISPLKEYLEVQKENARAKKANISEALVDESIAEQESVHAMEE